MDPPDCGPDIGGLGMAGVGGAPNEPGGRGGTSPAGGGGGPLKPTYGSRWEQRGGWLQCMHTARHRKRNRLA